MASVERANPICLTAKGRRKLGSNSCPKREVMVVQLNDGSDTEINK